LYETTQILVDPWVVVGMNQKAFFRQYIE
jgi:hypothetical protein